MRRTNLQSALLKFAKILVTTIFALGACLLSSSCDDSVQSQQSNAMKTNQSSESRATGEQSSGSQQTPAFVNNGQPGEMHRRLNALVGDWTVEKTMYMAGGTPDKPIVANGLTCQRQWLGETGNRHLQDVTKGSINNNPYYRMGILSYSTMDKRYEWNTVDATNANMMTYKGAKNANTIANSEISMIGEFTDQGLLGAQYAGKSIGMRTIIVIESPERHTVNLYMTPPGGKEFLADKAVYIRQNSDNR